jgi:hypothetical protein
MENNGSSVIAGQNYQSMVGSYPNVSLKYLFSDPPSVR